MNENTKIYFISILIALSIVEFFFFLQVTFVLKEFKIQYAVVPTLLGASIGFLVAKIQILKKQLERKEKLFHAIADEAREFSYFRTLDGTYRYVSSAVQELTGYTEMDFYNNKNFFNELILEQDAKFWQEHLDIANDTKGTHDDIELRIVHKSGKNIWISHNCSPVYEDGVKIGVRSINTDINKRKLDEAAIESLSHYDTLTNLPNRRYIFEMLENLKENKTPFTIVFVDLNRFKKVNDSLGHSTGDIVLQNVAKNFKSCMDEDVFVGRLGGDEFLIILEDIVNKEAVNLFTNKIYQQIAKDYTVHDYTFYIGASLGIAMYPNDAEDIHELLACADKAMYQAKHVTSTDIIYYSDKVQDSEFDDFLLERELREALKNNELDVYLQPKFDTSLEEITSYEALARWKKGDRFISPSIFIPLAEESGLIKDLTLYVVRKAFAMTKDLKHGKNKKKISINISMIDLMSNSIVENVKNILLELDVEANLFEFELTEGVFLENSEKIQSNIQEFIKIGFEISLDDFGTGYSSLSYLAKLPINTLKVDKAFIDNLSVDYDRNFPLLKSIVTIANDLGYKIVIEGVETPKQLEIVKQLGSFVIQGYYFYKPMSIQSINLLEVA